MQPVRDTSESREAYRRRRQEAIEAFLREFAPSAHQDLLAEMLVTVCRLAADGADRGDLKILNTALRELRYAFKGFAPYSHIPKVTIFGSARTPEDHPQYQTALKFAEMMRLSGWMVITGAGGGIMQAGHHGATRESSFGVAISLPFEQETNEIIRGDSKLINFKYFFTRKLMFLKEAKAICLFPGGFGTQDEGFECLTLVQTGKAAMVPIVLCDEPGGTYWQHWRTYVKAELLGNHMVDPSDMDLFFVTDSAAAAVDAIMRFYRRYHSSRYVRDRLILRMNTPLPEAVLTEINDTFADMLTSGRFEQVLAPLPEEGTVCPDKARLVFAHNRRSAGQVRRLIDRINRAD